MQVAGTFAVVASLIFVGLEMRQTQEISMSNAHYQYQQGFVSQEFWDSALASVRFQMSNPLARAIILERVERGVRPDFRDVVIGIDEELKSASGK